MEKLGKNNGKDPIIQQRETENTIKSVAHRAGALSVLSYSPNYSLK
jgi:hypothetical protein